MTLDEIKLQWEKDCEVDDIELDKSSLEVPKLHAKYSDCLLYTSPSPRDVEESRMPSSA